MFCNSCARTQTEACLPQTEQDGTGPLARVVVVLVEIVSEIQQDAGADKRSVYSLPLLSRDAHIVHPT